MPPPPIEQVAFLRSHEIADFDPGCLCLLGEERVSPPEWRREIALYSDYILHPSRLAKELEPASARVQSREEGERAWERAMELSSEVPLKVPCAEKAAAAAMAQDSWISFGRHAATLHVNPGFAAGKAGHLSMGQFENRHHERMGKGQIPVVTVDHLEFCLSVFRSLCMLPVWLHRPRLQLIKHCETVEHTDRQRGDTISACKFAERDRCALLFRLDVFMCVSLCRYRGVLVLPMSMHPDPEAKEPRVKVYLWDIEGRAKEAFLPATVLDGPDWESVGMLERMATGLDGERVVSGERYDSLRPEGGAARSCDLSELTPAACIEQAGRNPFPDFGSKWVCVGWDGRWFGFYGWMLIHVFVGDGSVTRVHVYSRQFEENPTCATASRGGANLYNVSRVELRDMFLTMD